MDFAAAVRLFLDRTRHARSGSPQTQRAYAADLAAFGRWLALGGLDWVALRRADAARYAAHLAAAGAPRTVRRRASCVRSFYRYLVQLEVAPRNPFDTLDLPAVDPFSETHKVLSAPELDAALGALRAAVRDAARAYAARRDRPRFEALFAAARRRAMFVVAVAAGLRRAELVGLRRASLAADGTGFALHVVGKGGRSRTVPLHGDAYPALCDYLTLRRAVPAASDALFLTAAGHPVTVRQAYHLCAWVARRVETGHALHPHVLRRTLATRLLEATHDLRAVQEQLGHRSVSTTQIYTHVDRAALRRVVEAAPLVASEHAHGPLLTHL